MGWIRIKRDNIELLVTTESYKDLFSKQGFDIVGNNSVTPEQNSVNLNKTKDKIRTTSKGTGSAPKIDVDTLKKEISQD